MKFKLILLYALALGSLSFVLHLLEYRFSINQLSIQAYLISIALLFAGLGAYFTYTLLQRNAQKSGVISQKSFSLPAADISISPREFEVLQRIACGYSNQEIADQLNVSLSTVKTHSSNIFAKLDVKRRTQAVQKAQQLGILVHSIQEV
jgi:two-component system, NarL family, response regulator LiaR